jgi:hypothetical protein
MSLINAYNSIDSLLDRRDKKIRALEVKLEVYEYALKKIAAEKETLGWLYAGQIAEKALEVSDEQ